MQARPVAIRLRCDVFCKVIDNYGDAAVALRLARILANEQQLAVRLFIDDTRPLTKLLGQLEIDASAKIDNVMIRAFDSAPDDVADIVVETFDCGLPLTYQEMLRNTSPQPAWINVEYLSAEHWVDEFHGLPSPPGDGGAVRHFFFPGFTSATGGLLREHELDLRRVAFRSDESASRALWAQLGVVCDRPEAPKVLMFCYTHGWPEDIFSRIAGYASQALHLIIPQGAMVPQVRAFCGDAAEGASGRLGQLQVSVVPFLAQARFDSLLWALDAGVIRGEDSFVRAQLAGLPLLWDIYPQSEQAHFKKLDAFLARYQSGMPEDEARRFSCLSRALIDRSEQFAGLFVRWCENLVSYRSSSQKWRQGLIAGPELGAELAKFARKLLEY